MLPGFRFLFAAIVLATSVLVFGLGAAALLRAAHEEIASIPTRRAPETVFAQQNETAPVLATLRVVDPPPPEKPAEIVAPASAPAKPAASVSTPAEPVATIPPVEPEKTAEAKPEDVPPAPTAKAEIPASESPPPADVATAPADAAATAEQTKTEEVKAADVKTAAAEPAAAPVNETAPAMAAAPPVPQPAAPPTNETAPVVAEPASPPVSPGAVTTSTKIATLGGPPVAIQTPPPPKTADGKPDKSEVKKRARARHARERRRLAQHARLTPQAPQPSADPFAQPTVAVRKR
jgi:hypothetical protein